MNWTWLSYSSHVICEAEHLQCFLMRCPETQGTVLWLMAMATQVGDNGSRYLVCSELLGHLPSVQKQASGQLSMLLGHHLGEPHMMCIISYLSARELLEWRPGMGNGRSLCELTFSSTASACQMNRGAGEPVLPVKR